MDVLSEALRSLPLSGSTLARIELRAPWGISVGGFDTSVFHFVFSGSGWLEMAGQPLRKLEARQVAVVVRGQPHQVLSGPRVPAVSIASLLQDRPGEQCPLLQVGGSGPGATMLCGYFKLDGRSLHPLLRLLPDVVHLPVSGLEPWLEAALSAVDAETASRRPGHAALVDRICGVLFVELVRACLEGLPEHSSGLVAGLRDDKIGAALAALHADLRRDWSVAELAKAAIMSRASFASRFTGLIGESPIQYLTRARMARAAHLLRAERLSLTEAMDRVGYSSESTFSKAFKRCYGRSPGEYRRAAASSPAPPHAAFATGPGAAAAAGLDSSSSRTANRAGIMARYSSNAFVPRVRK